MIVIRITESYAYDGVGNLAIVTERDGQIDKFCYDSFNRRVAAEYNTSDSTSPSNYNVCPSPTVTYTWAQVTG